MIKEDTQPILAYQRSTNFSNNLLMAAEPNEDHLLIIEDSKGRKEFPLENPVYSIGRDRNCNIRLISQFISRHHATLVRLPRKNDSPGYYYRIVDGDAKGKPSANGLIINGRKTPVYDLKNEDEIVFGHQVRAIYYLLKNTHHSGETDAIEYDITLINPDDDLRQQLEEFKIEIDHTKREKEVAMLTESSFFQEVQQEMAEVNLDEFWS
jgi:pSer/pThr/pTyr-binding forkhead associated (FHA) protein